MPDQLSVLIIGNFLSANGMNKAVCEELASQLQTARWAVLCSSRRSNRILRLLDMLWTVWHSQKWYSVALIDVYSGPSFLWAEAVSWALRRLHKPYILTLHGGNLPNFARRWPKRVRRLLDSASVVTSPSRYLQEQMGAYRTRVILISNPIDISAYTYIPRQAPNPRLVWLRAFHSIYNPSLSAKVVARLRAEIPNIQLVMVGPDKRDGSRAAFEAAVHELGVSENVRCIGGVSKSEVSMQLNRGDIFLNTTNVDNTPVSVIEAMACGLCIVSTNAGGVPYLLEDECDALLVPPDDPDAMANAVRRILTEPGLAERLSHNARAKAEQFDWTAVLPQWEQLLTNVAQQRKT